MAQKKYENNSFANYLNFLARVPTGTCIFRRDFLVKLWDLMTSLQFFTNFPAKWR